MLRPTSIRSGLKQDRYLLEVTMASAAPPLMLVVEAGGELVVRGETATLGPGFHAEVLARLDALMPELDYVWEDSFDAKATERQMCEWLAGELRGASGQVRIGVPASLRFAIDAPLLTPLGPRDTTWRDAVLAEPMHARDAFPWWERGTGREELARALVAMWLDVPWREPLDKDERELMQRVDDDLRAARKADESLALPWAAWRELLAHLGIEDEEVSAKAGGETSAIGYRRYDLDIEVAGGWSVRLPGVMAGNFEDDGARYWATDGDRMIEVATLTAEGEVDSDKLLAVAPEKHPVIARLTDGPRRGRAEAFVEDGTPIVIGLVAHAPHVAILTCKGGDEEWALATWRSLRQVD